MAVEGTLGRLLISYRRSAGYSQQQLAERSGVSASTISDIETGVSQAPRPSTLRDLADTLGLSAQERGRLLAAGLPAPDADAAEAGQQDRSATQAGQFLTLAATLARLRRRAEMSVPDLADRSGLNGRTIRNIEKGRTTRIQPQSARALADAVGLTDPEQRRNFFTLAAGGNVPVAGLAGTRISVPIVPAGLHGRVREYADLLAWLGEPGLVTITGPGGVGKTALATAAWRERGEPRRRMEFATLPRGHDATLGLATLAGLDDSPPGQVLDRVADGLADVCLLLLDNLEHLEGAAEMVAGLLARRSDICVLATSRRELAVDGERILPLRTLEPDAARTMFDTVASRAGRSAPADPRAEAAVIDDICARLDGLPLAIELAAAWSAMLTPQDILAQLTHPGRLLRRPGPGSDRQTSIASTVDWSLRLLPAGSATLFRELSVFRSSWPLHLIEAVHQDPDMLESLQQLTASGLVRVDQEGPVSRFSMLQTVQDVGRDLADADHALVAGVLGRHAGHLVRRARELAPDLNGPHTARAIALLGADYLHYESALRHLTSIADPRAIQLSAALWRYWQHTGKYRTGLALIRPALRACEDDHPGSTAECRYGAGVLGYLAGEIEAATADARTALRLFRESSDITGMGSVMSLLGMISLYTGDLGEAVRWYTDGLSKATWEAAPRSHATLLSNLALVREEQADLIAASQLAEEAAVRYRLLGDMRGVAIQLGNLGSWSGQVGDVERARDLLNETRQIFAELRDFNGLREVYHRLTELALNAGDLTAAADALKAADEYGTELDDPWGDSTAGSFSAELTLYRGDVAGALRQAQVAGAQAAALRWRPAMIRALLVQAVSIARQGRRMEAVRAAGECLQLCTPAHAAAIASVSLLVASLASLAADEADVAAPAGPALARKAAIVAAWPGARPYALIGLVTKIPETSAGGDVTAAELREQALLLCGELTGVNEPDEDPAPS